MLDTLYIYMHSLTLLKQMERCSTRDLTIVLLPTYMKYNVDVDKRDVNGGLPLSARRSVP